MDNTNTLKAELEDLIENTNSMEDLERIRISALGKKGKITALMKDLSALEPEKRKVAGKELNLLKQIVSRLINDRKNYLENISLESRLVEEKIDITLPIRPEEIGTIHPISQTTDELISIFGEMGFVVAEGPSIEEDWYNFTALNIPVDHPARQEHDTFYINAKKEGLLSWR